VTFKVWATDETTGFDCWFSGGRGLAGNPGSEGPAAGEGTALSEGPANALDLVRKLCAGSGGQMRVLAPGRGDGVMFRLEFRRKQPRATR
jgi:hypothetical protein